jgi:hypothetical protein
MCRRIDLTGSGTCQVKYSAQRLKAIKLNENQWFIFLLSDVQAH